MKFPHERLVKKPGTAKEYKKNKTKSRMTKDLDISEETIEKIIQKYLDGLYESEGKEHLKEGKKHLSYKDFLKIALDFFECENKIRSTFPCIKGFMFREGQLSFIVDNSADDNTKKEIRDVFVNFADLGRIIEMIESAKSK